MDNGSEISRSWRLVERAVTVILVPLLAGLTVVQIGTGKSVVALETRMHTVEDTLVNREGHLADLADLRVRVAHIEGNRFTAADWQREAAILYDRIMGAPESEWLRDDMREIKAAIQSIDERLRKVEQKLP